MHSHYGGANQWLALMPSLQIRDLETQAGSDSRRRRQAALDRIEKRSPLQSPPVNWTQSPEDLIRADRES
jgi:hypothetical protein